MNTFLELGVSQSLLKDFQTCKQKALWKLQGWKSGEADWQMYFGTLFHDVMESYFKELRDNAPTEFCVDVEVEKARKKIFADPTYNTTTPYDIERYLLTLKLLVKYYVAKYAEKDEKKKWLVVEEPFVVDTKHVPAGVTGNNKPFQFRGKPDVVAEEGDGIWLYDHKTKGYVDLDEIKLWLPHDLQMHAYVWALEKKLSRKFVGFVYDVVKVPALKQKWGETLEAYGARLVAGIEVDPDLYFTRLRVRIKPTVREQAEQEFGELLQDYIEWNQHLRPTKNKQACFYYGKKCPFFEACFANSFSQLHQGPVFEELCHRQ